MELGSQPHTVLEVPGESVPLQKSQEAHSKSIRGAGREWLAFPVGMTPTDLRGGGFSAYSPLAEKMPLISVHEKTEQRWPWDALGRIRSAVPSLTSYQAWASHQTSKADPSLYKWADSVTIVQAAL